MRVKIVFFFFYCEQKEVSKRRKYNSVAQTHDFYSHFPADRFYRGSSPMCE